jgi:hypothetical protein
LILVSRRQSGLQEEAPMQESGFTRRGLFKRRADLAYAVALGLALAVVSLGLEAVIDFIS